MKTVEFAKKGFLRTTYALNITWCPESPTEADNEYQEVLTHIHEWAAARKKAAGFVLVTFVGDKPVSDHVVSLLKKAKGTDLKVALPIQYSGLLGAEKVELDI
ncbi:MAG: hypothetical protein QGG42_17285 [Phycisphaerae bacterium]|jgi:hypothetical protein|nr:hypothetical protein [Phycisphaerae bacterium]